MEAPAVPFVVPAPAAPTPLVMEAPQPLPEPTPVAMPEPVQAEAPRHETLESEPVVVKEQSIKAASILVQPHTATAPVPTPAPAPAAAPKQEQEEEIQPLVKQSIFSMVDDEDEDEDEVEEEEDEFVDEMEDTEEEEAEQAAPEQPRSPEAAASHWADKYIQAKPHAGVQPTVEPRREPQRSLQATAAAPAKKVIEVKQPSLNLQQEEVARFKGTDKTIVDGDDLDIPTWMRLRGKVKR
jgi:cell division protein FtsZ